MIRIKQPAMVLNAPDLPARYVMHATYDVPSSEAVDVSPFARCDRWPCASRARR